MGKNHRKYIGYYRKSHEKWRTLAGTTTIFYALTVLLMGNQMKNMGKDRKSA